MNVDRLLIASVLCLAVGLSVIVSFCHGTAGFNAAYPFAGASLQIGLTTTGLPAMLGFALTVIGLLLLIWATVSAVLRQVESPSHGGTASQRESAAG
jgi:uncharacterized membrane protein